ncbi:MAG TPA: sigma 54-interacting transcriptional regulator [Thermodesulfobacteriota bacterium]|nr:sigma 54-interacting transcriptional regulator [Thermodesulfobacteriota bacterium]
MKPKLCIVGYRPVIAISRKVAAEFREEADFIFVISLLEEALIPLREIEGVADIVLAGPSTRRMYSPHLKIPIVSFGPTFPDLIRAIQGAQTFDSRIALCLSRDDQDFDLPLLSRVMKVSIFPFYCDTSEEYEKACRDSKEKGYQVVIGGSFTVGFAQKIGLKGILLYKGMDMIRTAVKKALEICRIQYEGIRRISQLTAVVNHFPEGLFLTDEAGQIILDNPPAQARLGVKKLQGRRVGELFPSKIAEKVLRDGEKVLNVIERNNLVVNYIPVRSPEGIHGLVCTFSKIAEIEDAEFTVRKRLHDRGFAAKYVLDDIKGASPAIRAAKEKALLFASAPGPVLITGESGTGKELFAHALHALSDQRKGPFLAINCATLPSELLESELFGYEKGAFTGARAYGKKGLIELAHKGTLFLDEITSLSYPLQAKLLRLLSEHEILKLGSDRIIPVEVRILAATNLNIEMCVADRQFREDLYYRLNAFRLHLPPLRERPEDLVPLFLHFVGRIRKEIAAPLVEKKQTIRKVLENEFFGGNVRELENIARRFCLFFYPDRNEEEIDSTLASCLEGKEFSGGVEEKKPNLKTVRQSSEKDLIQDLMRKYQNRKDVARFLEIDRSTLWRKLKQYGLPE